MFRHEQKYIIHRFQYEEIKRILGVFTERDEHAGPSGEYMVRSLYFDDLCHSAYWEKQDGVYRRKKYRIRIYDCRDNVIEMECKQKEEAYIQKEAFGLTREEFHQIRDGRIDFLLEKESQMAKELYVDFRTKGLKPEVIVDYEREAFVYKAGNVRITFDKNVRACSAQDDFFGKDIPSYSVFPADEMIMEIKFTEYLPERIRQIFKVRNLVQTSASKYCLCVNRMNGIR